MATNKARDRAVAKAYYGDSEKIFGREVRPNGFVSINTILDRAMSRNFYGVQKGDIQVSNLPDNFTKRQRCYCPECRQISGVHSLDMGQTPSNEAIDSVNERDDEEIYECDNCGYVDRLAPINSYDIEVERVAKDGNPSYEIRFAIPLRRDCFLSSRDGMFTRFVDSASFYLYTYDTASGDDEFSREVMRSIIDVNGQSRSVQQMTTNGDGDLIAVHHTADRLNPNYHITPFPIRGEGLGFDNMGDVFAPIMPDNSDDFPPHRVQRMIAMPVDRDTMNDVVFDVTYDRIRKHFGLKHGKLVSNNTKRAIILMSVLYPGVVEREMSIIDENVKYAKQRGETVNDFEVVDEKMDKLFDVRHKIALIDHNISSDLSKLKTKEEVTTYLRSIVFGESPKVKLPKLMIDVTKSKMLDDGYGGKKLRKMFQKDPYATASNVRTARKMGILDVNHLNLLFSAAEQNSHRASKDGVLYPLETAAENRFVRTMVKERDRGRVISDIYIPSSSGEDGIQFFSDAASMYDNMCKRGVKFARTKEEATMVKYLDFLHLAESRIDTSEHIHQFVESGGAPDWGPHTEAILAEMSDKVEEYKESGFWDDIYRAARNGKSLFGRDLRELHDELVYLQNRTNGGSAEFNNHYVWNEEDRARVERDYGDYKFRLAKDSNELVRVGRILNICIGDPSYDRRCVNHTSGIILMLDKNDNYVAACETDPSFKRVSQFYAYRDQYLYGELVPPARQWLKDTGIKGNSHTEAFNEHAQKKLDGHDFTVRGAVERPEVDPLKDITVREATIGAELADKLSAEKLEEKYNEVMHKLKEINEAMAQLQADADVVVE